MIALDEYLANQGFSRSGKREYRMLRNEMLFVLSRQGRKRDLHWFYAIWPLQLPGIWPAMAWRQACGRFPTVDGPTSAEPSEQIWLDLLGQCPESFSQCQTLDELEALYRAGNQRSRYPLAFCLFAQSRLDEGRAELDAILASFADTVWSPDIEEQVRAFASMPDDASLLSALQQARQANIRSLRLGKLL